MVGHQVYQYNNNNNYYYSNASIMNVQECRTLTATYMQIYSMAQCVGYVTLIYTESL
jgi:hypothetical protein